MRGRTVLVLQQGPFAKGRGSLTLYCSNLELAETHLCSFSASPTMSALASSQATGIKPDEGSSCLGDLIVLGSLEGKQVQEMVILKARAAAFSAGGG